MTSSNFPVSGAHLCFCKDATPTSCGTLCSIALTAGVLCDKCTSIIRDATDAYNEVTGVDTDE